MSRIQNPGQSTPSEGSKDRDEDSNMEATEPKPSPANGHADLLTGIQTPHEDPDALSSIEPLAPLEDAAPELSDLFEADQEDRTLRVGAGPVKGIPDEALVTGLCEARQRIETVERNGYNSYLKHEYATYDDVMRAVAEPLAEAGVWCFPSVVDTFKQYAGTNQKGADQWIITVVLETLWSAGGSTVRSYWIGETIDSGDKHHYQLLSQVTKYALAKTLMLDTGDADVDADHVEPSKNRPSRDGKGSPAGEAATERQLSYIRSLQEKCRARGGSDDEHELLRVTAKSKQLASEQIEGLKQLEKQLTGAGTDE